MRQHLIACMLAGSIVQPAVACTLIATPGTLALSADKSSISSEGTLGALITVSTTILDGSFTLTIAAPSWDQWPVAFPQGTAVLRQRTVTTGTLNLNAAYTTGAISKTFPPTLVDAAVVSLHHQIVASSYPEGRYRTKTVVTCS